MNIKMIAMDMDGTLLDDQGNLPAENLNALKRAREMGVLVAICTGRYPENGLLLMRDAGFPCWVIGTNGARIINERGEALSAHPMKPKAVAAVCDLLRDRGASYFVFGERFLCTSHQSRPHHSELRYGERMKEELGFEVFHGPEAMAELTRRPILKFYINDNGDLSALRNDLSRIPDVQITRSGDNNIELIDPGVDKATGVMELASRFGIDIADVMTFGDQENDVPMLQAAGWGVAMGNAPDAVKAQARLVTAENIAFGVAKAIEQYVLAAQPLEA